MGLISLDRKDAIKNLLEKYKSDKYLMYVEYPQKVHWSTGFGDLEYRSALKGLFAYDMSMPLALYIHIPFCKRQCYFCICYSKVTKDYERVRRYLDYLYKEIDLLRDFFDKNSIILDFQELHLGGGSPTYLEKGDFVRLMKKIGTICDLKKLKEATIEVDPREAAREKMVFYHSLGFNRLSVGVQDFDPVVQKAVNRVQPQELIEALIAPEIRKCFTKGINFDILCGLPRQTKESFRRTVNKLIELSPDRTCIIFVNYAPEYRKHQRLIKRSEVPDSYEKTVIFEEAVHMLLEDGYVRIGFDHFARPNDSLAEAMMKRDVHWNGLGYRAGNFVDIIGIGASSASRMTENYYSQNFYELPYYEEALSNRKFPVYKGYVLGDDEIIRREIIHRLRAYFFLDCSDIERKYSIKFREYFREEQILLNEFVRDDILEISDSTIELTEMGIHFIYLVCRIFDRFSRSKSVL